MVNTYRDDILDRGGGDWLFDKEEGTIYERLRISLIAPMVITYRDDTLDRDGGDWLFDKGRGIYAEDYEFH